MRGKITGLIAILVAFLLIPGFTSNVFALLLNDGVGMGSADFSMDASGETDASLLDVSSDSASGGGATLPDFSDEPVLTASSGGAPFIVSEVVSSAISGAVSSTLASGILAGLALEPIVSEVSNQGLTDLGLDLIATRTESGDLELGLQLGDTPANIENKGIAKEGDVQSALGKATEIMELKAGIDAEEIEAEGTEEQKEALSKLPAMEKAIEDKVEELKDAYAEQSNEGIANAEKAATDLKTMVEQYEETL